MIFPIDIFDTIFVLTVNNSVYKEGVGNIISKMLVIKELKYVNLDKFSAMLDHMGIEELKIFSVQDKLDIKPGSNPLVFYFFLYYKNKYYNSIRRECQILTDEVLLLDEFQAHCVNQLHQFSLFLL